MYVIEANTLWHGYYKALSQLKYFGDVVESKSWGTKRLEVPIAISILNPLDHKYIPKAIPGGADELQKYVAVVCDGTRDWAIAEGKQPYTYHDRIFGKLFKTVDIMGGKGNIKLNQMYIPTSQFKEAIGELRRDPASTRAVIAVLDKQDSTLEHRPCLNHLQFMIRSNGLIMYSTFRSNDAIKASYFNMYALIKLGQEVAGALGVKFGEYTHVAHSYHVYERDIPQLNLADERYGKYLDTGDLRQICYTNEEFFGE